MTIIGMAMVANEIPAQMKNVRNIRLRISISNAIGTPINPANGHPNKAAIAIKKIARGYF